MDNKLIGSQFLKQLKNAIHIASVASSSPARGSRMVSSAWLNGPQFNRQHPYHQRFYIFLFFRIRCIHNDINFFHPLFPTLS